MPDRSTAVGPRRGLLALLTAAEFLIIAQAFMIAPVLPRRAQVWHTSTGVAGLAVPACLVPYGVTTLVWRRRRGAGPVGLLGVACTAAMVLPVIGAAGAGAVAGTGGMADPV